MKDVNKVLYIIICLVIIAGVIVWKSKGFNLELQYSTRDQINISNNQEINTDEVKAIVSEVLGNNTRYIVQNVEIFGNYISVVADEIIDEQKNEIVNKFNEKYGTKVKADDIETVKIPFTRVKDVIKPFIIPAIIIFILILAYFLIRFKNLEWQKVLAKTAIIPVIAELLLYSIIAICRIPFGRVAIAAGVTLYVIVIAVLANCFENERENKIIENLEEKERND